MVLFPLTFLVDQVALLPVALTEVLEAHKVGVSCWPPAGSSAGVVGQGAWLYSIWIVWLVVFFTD